MGLTRTKSGIIVAGDIADAAVLTDAIADEAVTAAKFDDTAEPMGRVFYAADTTARDALTARASDRCLVTGQGDHGVWYFYDGTNWIIESGQLLETVTLGATGTISLTNIVSGFSKLMVRYSIRGVASGSDTDGLACYLDGDTTNGNYHRQNNAAANGAAVVAETTDPGVGVIPATTAVANSFGIGEVDIINYDEVSRIKHMVGRYVTLTSANDVFTGMSGVAHDGGFQDAVDTSIELDGINDDLAAGSWAELWGY